MHSFGTIIFFLFSYLVVYNHAKSISDNVLSQSGLTKLRKVPQRLLAPTSNEEAYSDEQPAIEYQEQGLTQAQMIGIGVGFGAGGAFCIMTLVAVWERRHSQRHHQGRETGTEVARKRAHLHAIATSLREAKRYNAEEGEKPMQGILLIPTPRKDMDLMSTESGGRVDSIDYTAAKTPLASSTSGHTSPLSTPALRTSVIVPYVFTTSPSTSQGQLSPTPRDSLVAYLSAHSPSPEIPQTPASLCMAEGTVTTRLSGQLLHPDNGVENNVSHGNDAITCSELRKSKHQMISDQDFTIAKKEPLVKPALRLPIPPAGSNGDYFPHLKPGSISSSNIQAESSPQTPSPHTARLLEHSVSGPTDRSTPFTTSRYSQGDALITKPEDKEAGDNGALSARPQGATKELLKNQTTYGKSVGHLDFCGTQSRICAKKEGSRSPPPSPHRKAGLTPVQRLEKIPLTELVANNQAPPSPQSEAELTYQAYITCETMRESKVHALAEYVKRVTASESRGH